MSRPAREQAGQEQAGQERAEPDRVGPERAARERVEPVASDCTFCRIVAGELAAHVVADDDRGLGFLDRRPLFAGHTLVVPRTHVPTLAELAPDRLAPFFGLVRELAAAYPAVLGCGGTFVAMNNVVSQSVPHLHAHVVPRTKGDGLRGFFWPRRAYEDGEAEAVAATIRAGLAGRRPTGD